MIDYLRNKARSFIFTTGLPPAIVASVRAAVQVVQQENWGGQSFWRKPPGYGSNLLRPDLI